MTEVYFFIVFGFFAIFFILLGFLLGYILARVIEKPKLSDPPPIHIHSKTKKPIFASPDIPEEIFNKAKTLDDFIKK